MAKAKKAKTKQKTTDDKPRTGRPDQRYKDRDNAPPIVSEKRLTFFVPEVTYRQLRRYAGVFQAANAYRDDEEEKLPESPSALLREAVYFYLDQLRDDDDETIARKDEEWDARFDELREAARSL